MIFSLSNLPFQRQPGRHRFFSSRRGIFLGALSMGALGLFEPAAQAQNRPAPAKAGDAPAPRLIIPGVTAPQVPTNVPLTPQINILVLALDSLELPAGTVSTGTLPVLPPAPGALTPLLPAPTLPKASVTIPPRAPDAPPSAIAPTSWNGLTTQSPIWVAQAQQKPLKPRKKTQAEKDAETFSREPESGMTRPSGTSDAAVAAAARTLGSGAPGPGAPGSGLSSGAAGGNSFGTASGLVIGLPVGRVQNAALSLRRALMSRGWSDVLAAAPNASGIISSAAGERRLTPRTLSALRQALSQLANPTTPQAPIPPEATRSALLAASRLGQTLGYRAVVVLYVSPSTTKDGTQNASYSMVLADSEREQGEPILFDESGLDETTLRDAGALTGAALLDKTLRGWPDTSPANRKALAQRHFSAARAAIAMNDPAAAQEELSQVVGLDPSRAEPLVMLGDLLSATDPVGAAAAYRRAVELNAADGVTWTKIAVALSSSAVPDWPRALEAGRQALAANYDSAELRVAMATAQFGRADLFRTAERLDRADDAEAQARIHLDRALELSPDDPAAVQLLVGRLIDSRRYEEATQTLDRVAPRYPKDLEIQSQYAAALIAQTGREEDAFAAFARVWKLSDQRVVPVDEMTYRSLMQGFDSRVYNLGKSAAQLTTGVANGALPRESALIQLTRLKEDMELAVNAIGVLRAPVSIGLTDGPASRAFAADLMSQALEAMQMYLETGQEQQRIRGSQFNSQAVARLNAARIAGG